METLSDKRYRSYEPTFHYKEADVKEFIKKLKKWCDDNAWSEYSNKNDVIGYPEINEIIDTLAGEKLWKD